jgi:hypothetical protein
MNNQHYTELKLFVFVISSLSFTSNKLPVRPRHIGLIYNCHILHLRNMNIQSFSLQDRSNCHCPVHQAEQVTQTILAQRCPTCERIHGLRDGTFDM